MKQIHNSLFLLIAMTVWPEAQATISPLPHHKKLCQMVQSYTRVNHYTKPKFDVVFHKNVFSNFINRLDERRIYFNEADIAELEALWLQEKSNGVECSLEPPFAVYDRFRTRVIDRYRFAINSLDQTYEFNQNDTLPKRKSMMPWFASDKDSDEYWKKWVKNDLLNLTLADLTLLKAREVLKQRYERAIQIMLDATADDYMNSYLWTFTETLDPHTNYLPPIRKRASDFDREPALNMVGIGMVVKSDDVYSRVVSLVAGGPAELAGGVNAGDYILAIAEGDNEPVDVRGWRVDDVVKLMRGKVGTNVTLTLVDDIYSTKAMRHVSIKRQKISLNDQRVSYQLFPGNDAVAPSLAHVRIPRFYVDFEARAKGDDNYSSVSRDLSNILIELLKKNVEGIVLDLRDNSGGGLDEAIQIIDMFIDAGPALQERYSGGRINLVEAESKGRVWDRPLLVLVNQRSAGASEIVAATLRDYQRAIIVGEQTNGLGTIASLFDLNRLRSDETTDFGQLKCTVAKYYRVTGQSIHIDGVSPDIAFASPNEFPPYGEKTLRSVLPFDYVPSFKFARESFVPESMINTLRSLSAKRMQANSDFSIWKSALKKALQSADVEAISLNLAKRKELQVVENQQDRTAANIESVKLNEAKNVLADLVKMKSQP